jgi:type II secretion system protein I
MRRVPAGFTLIEVVFALAILAFAFFGMVSVITYAARSNQASRERMLAMRAAERKIEQMLSCTTFDDIYSKFSAQTEGAGWEQVQEMDSTGAAQPALLPATFTTADRTMTTGFVYGVPDTKAVLFVRFPLNTAGTGFNEVGTDKFTGMAANLDLNRSGATTDADVQIADCKVLPVSIEVYWKSTVMPKAYLIYKYTFLRKT